MRNANLRRLSETARLLRPLLEDLVFVGGAVTSLLVTDEGSGLPRTTLDVDAISEIGSYAEYAAFGERLRALGFCEDLREGAPLCRWLHGQTVLDVMPIDEKVLGFSNRWYKPAIDASQRIALQENLKIRVVTAPYFLATKIEAFHGRGRGDFLGSHDLEDLIFLIDGRPELPGEVSQAEPALRTYLGAEFARWLENARFLDALPGHLLPDAASQARISLVLERMRSMSF